MDDLRPGDPSRLGGYRLASRLGSGGQGVVYEGYDRAANRVAVKVLHAYLAGDSPLRRRFTREVSAAQRVASFCTARILDHDLEGERPYIVTEFVPGPSLRRAVTERPALDPDALHRLAVGVGTALTAIHQAGVVHRDLKPENVLLGHDGPRVIDFGIARAAGLSMTSTGELTGTPMYMAPELFSGGRAEAAADVFAWGAVVYFAATGRDAFAGPTTIAVINRVLNHDPCLGALPEGLRELVGATLSKDPAARPSAERLLLTLLGGGGHPVLAEGAEAAASVRPPRELAAEPALGTVAEEVYAALPATDRDVARDLLLRLVDVSDGDETPRRATVDELVETPHPAAGRVLAAFEQATLIRRQDDTITLTRAALLYAWPRLHEWVNSDREGLGRHRELGEAARRWAGGGRHPEDLLQGAALRQALSWASATRLTLNVTEKEFVEASQARSARRTRRRRLLTTGVAAMLAVTLTAGGLAWQQSLRSDASDASLAEERARAAARRVALQADALRGTDPVKAMLLSVAAHRIAPVPEAGAAVLSSLAQQEQRVFTDPAPANGGRALSADGRTLVSAGAGRVTAYDVRTGRAVRTFGGVGEGPFTAALGPDGDTLALARQGTVALWSLRTGARLGAGRYVPEGSGLPAGLPGSLEFSPGGGYLVVRQNLGGPYVGLWNVARRSLEMRQAELSDARLGPGDRFGSVEIVAERSETSLRGFPDEKGLAGRRLPEPLPGPVLAFSPDGSLAAVGEGTRTELWNLFTGKRAERVFPGDVSDAAFSDDGRFLITSGRDAGGRLSLWRLDDGAPLLRLTIASTLTGPPRLDPENRTLSLLDESGRVTTYDISRQTRPPLVLPAGARDKRFTAGVDALFARTGGTVRRWSLPGLSETGPRVDIAKDGGPIMLVSPDGRTVVTSRWDDHTEGVTLWDATTGRALGRVPLSSETERAAMEISPDNRLLAVSHTLPNDLYGRGEVVVIDLARREQVMRFGPVAGGALSFSADGRFLVTADPAGADVIDLISRKPLPRSEGPGTLARGWMALAPKGGLAASPYGTRAVALWDSRTWRTTGRVFRLPGDVLGARFSPDGRILAVAHDNRVTLFDVAAGRQLGAGRTVTTDLSDPRDSDEPVPALAFSPDGALLHVVGRDGTVQELPVDPARAASEVCARAGRALTREEWREHVGADLAYQPVCG
ncbi:serine/threonine-protein kinase [Nonomuraea cavernae]|uniref:serine/threonine-protein kinase n=1 Tax=Nonomuraea cavernae TaxID=2045107 RepID=UPI0033C02B11